MLLGKDRQEDQTGSPIREIAVVGFLWRVSFGCVGSIAAASGDGGDAFTGP